MKSLSEIDTEKKWYFHMGAIVPNQYPISWKKEKEGVLSFSHPLDVGKKLTIRLLAIDPKGKKIEGEYVVTGINTAQKVYFYILNEGKVLNGYPTGTHSRFSWILTCS